MDNRSIKRIELKTGMVLRWGMYSSGDASSCFRAVLRAKPIKGRVHVYSGLGVDYETELEALDGIEFVEQCASGPEARNRVDELCGHHDRIARRRERSAAFATRKAAL